MKRAINLGYFGRTINLSETFINELLFGLNEKCNLTLINGYDLRANYPNIKEIVSGYKNAHWLNKFRTLKLMFKYFKSNALENIEAKYRLNKLIRILKDERLDVAYTDYGINAVQIIDYIKFRRIPLIVHFHGYDITSKLKDVEYRNKLEKVLEYSTYFIAASHHIKRLLMLQGCSADKIKVIRYGISMPSAIKIQPWDKRFNNKPKIIFIGRLAEKKNPLALIYAFSIVLKRFPDAVLEIIGDGPLLHNCRGLVSKLDIKENVMLLGALEHNEALKRLANGWIYAQHSTTSIDGDQEGFAISPAEAALLELPVVSTLHNGIPEHVIENKTGFLVREFDFESMGEKLIELLNNRTLLKEFGQNGRKNILEMCNPVRRINEVYQLVEKCRCL